MLRPWLCCLGCDCLRLLPLTSPAFLKKHVVRAVGSTVEAASFVTRTAVDPALRVDLEYRCHARQHSLASVRGRIELEPRNVIRGLARRLGDDFGAHCTAVGVDSSIKFRVIKSVFD
jgi:hypothetical protein